MHPSRKGSFVMILTFVVSVPLGMSFSLNISIFSKNTLTLLTPLLCPYLVFLTTRPLCVLILILCITDGTTQRLPGIPLLIFLRYPVHPRQLIHLDILHCVAPLGFRYRQTVMDSHILPWWPLCLLLPFPNHILRLCRIRVGTRLCKRNWMR